MSGQRGLHLGALLATASLLCACGGGITAGALAEGAPLPVELHPEDVATIDGIVKAYYDIVSGGPGVPRPWARDRALYLHLPTFRFVAVDVHPDGAVQANAMSHAAFAAWSDEKLAPQGFFEHEIHRVTQRFGDMVHVMSTYESRRTQDGPVIARGINSLELVWDGKRWWIASSVWQEEGPGNPLPKEFLPE